MCILFSSNKVLQLTSGIEDMQNPKWDLSLCNLFVWLLTFLVLSKGIKSLGKVWNIRSNLEWTGKRLSKFTIEPEKSIFDKIKEFYDDPHIITL